MKDFDRSALDLRTAEALADYSSIYGDGFCRWIAELWDSSGGFYYSESARDNEGFLPDIESTCQVLYAMRGQGLFAAYGGDMRRALPVGMQRRMISFTDGLQGEDGFFYHPQWGRDIPAMRRGRDLSWAKGMYTILGGEPPYAFADQQMKEEKGSAVAEHLRSPEAFREYLYSHDLKTKFHWLNHKLSAQHSEIKSAGLMPVLFEFLEREQDPETGLWGDGVNYDSLTALMKGMLIYAEEKRPFAYAVEAVSSAIDILTTDAIPARIVDITNPSNALLNILDARRRICGEAEAEKLRLLVAARGAEICESSREKLLPYMQSPDVFSFLPYVVAPTSQNLPAAVEGTAEGDVNATVIAYGHLKRVKTLLGLSDTECFGDAEYRMFLETLRSRDPSVFY